MSEKSYRGQADIQQMGGRQPLVKSEYTNYDEYLSAQDQVHRELLSKPAKTCELCGYPMDYNNHVPSEWERKWSIHSVCKRKLDGMLDRETGISRERKAMNSRASGRRY